MTATQPPRQLGMRWGGAAAEPVRDRTRPVVNTRTSLWPTRWPAIALQSCIDEVEAAPPDEQARVKFELPCKTCEKNTACLNAKSKEVGSLMYSREYRTQPRSSESTLFPYELFEAGMLPGESLSPVWRPPFTRENEYAVAQAWDLAWSEKAGGDWLVCMTGYLHRPSGRRRLLDIQRWQQIEFDDQVQLIARKWAQARADAVVLEGDAAQQIWRKHMARNTSVPVMSHNVGRDKPDLQIGVPGLLIQLENRKWEFPSAPGYHREELDNFLTEMEAFGWVDGKLQGVGEHDDTVMAFWHLNHVLNLFAGEAGL